MPLTSEQRSANARRGALTKMTPEQRQQRARIGALARWAKENPSEQGRAGQAGLLRRFEAEVDPDGVLPAAERERRAYAAHRAHMARLALASSRARSRAASD